MQDILLKTIINDDAKLLLEITEKQPLAMSKFFFFDRQQPTHSCRSAVILRFLKPDSREVLQTT